MNRSPILFRCDGSPDLGWEFFYQCLTYGAALQRRRRPTYFLSDLRPMTLVGAVNRAGCEWIASEHPFGSVEDCEETIRQVHRLGAGGVVLSGPDVSQDYLRELSAAGATVTVIDTEARLEFDSQLVINPTLSADRRDYRFAGNGQLLSGGRYAIVRPIFRRQRPLRAAEPVGPTRALVALGEADFAGQTLARCKELLGTTRVDRISVVARGHHPDYPELRDLASSHSGRMEIISEPNEIGTRLARAHFALTSGSTWSLEIACVGIPQLIISQCEGHRANAQRMDDEGAATFLGMATEVTEGDLRQAIHSLLSDQLERIGMARCARQLVDGRGPDRLVTAMEVMLQRGQTVSAPRLAA